jgi:predicted signal transduction protein with EAL and GGDEF domain
MALGCTSGQGFLFARPVDSDVVSEILRTGAMPAATLGNAAPAALAARA